MQLFRSLSDSPAVNGAYEKYFLTSHPARDVLLFYINRPAVIVGRNQSIEAEVNLTYCQVHGIEIVRRISGGGAVYHDEGNINYAFIVQKNAIAALDRDFSTPILNALNALHIHATVGKRKELLINGLKISGVASHITREKILFHGTLLHRTNLTHLSEALQGNTAMRGRNIASIPGNVVNITDLTGGTETTVQFLDSMLDFLKIYYNTQTINILSDT
ncbi:MAG: lipoate--protein ligase family protein [Tannerella sp.]|jgi:lipoate-protein ligase A|nr:lipoate--protein ligase family protein [Tannerella sp.]